MPAGLPGDSLFNNQGNPNAGRFVTFDPLSGPKDAPFDAKKIDYSTGTPAGWDAATRVPIKVNDDANVSTGGLSTGIGIGAQVIGLTAPAAINAAGFPDNLIPGEVPTYAAPPPPNVVASNAINSTRMYIGGGRSVTSGSPLYANPAGQAGCSPYTAGVAICGAGNGGSRDSGANTGFPVKMVTATGTVANGAAIEAGFVNRSGVSMTTGQSSFGSAAVALAAPS